MKGALQRCSSVSAHQGYYINRPQMGLMRRKGIGGPCEVPIDNYLD